MPMCAVLNCSNYSRKTKGADLVYHTFPKDEEFRNIWISKCNRSDHFNVATARVCSEHFTPDDYLRDLENEFLGLPPKRRGRLKPNAIPHMKLPEIAGDDQNSAVPPQHVDHKYCCKPMDQLATQQNNDESWVRKNKQLERQITELWSRQKRLPCRGRKKSRV